MSDGLFEFFDDDTTAGFRLKQVELYNWGTFDGKVVRYALEGRNGLLTGDIGSGKSTIVDAVTTLLVPAHRVSYNKAAGADFKERSLRSYVMGYYKSERSDGGFSAKPVALRKEGTSHSVILGVFHNEGYGQTVTLAQVFLQKESTGQPDRFFVVSHRELSIEEHFSDFGKELSPLKKRLKSDEKTEVFDSFPPYGAAFRRLFGLQNEQALELFHQTVSLKTVGNLTSFVQEHMLEPFDTESLIENLIHHYEDLSKAHEAILRARNQIGILKPLVENLDSHKSTREEVDEKTLLRDGLKYYFAQLKSGFLRDRIEGDREKKNRISLKIDQAVTALGALRNQRDQIRQAISANGGDRLEQLKGDMTRFGAEKENKQRRADEYDELAAALGYPLYSDSDRFSESRNASGEEIARQSSERDRKQNDLMELNFSFRELNAGHDELSAEINSLKARKSNIDSRQIKLRERLCADLDVDERELPFAGELLMVREEEKLWEGALERVLRNFALSLLVPEKLYEQVSQWVDETNLRGRLVYYRVGGVRKSQVTVDDSSSLTEKITLKEGSPFRDWLKEQLRSRYNYSCCTTLDEFRRRTGRALTMAGQVKGSAVHHEKDDRFAIDDRSRYVLGWQNQTKIAAMESRKMALEKEIAGQGAEISRFQIEIRQLEERLDQLKKLNNVSNFDDLNWKPVAMRIEELKDEIHQLKNRSDVLAALQEKLSGTDEEISAEEQSLDELKNQRSKIEQKLEDGELGLKEEEAVLQESENPPRFWSELFNPLVSSYLDGKKLYYETCGTAEHLFREKLQGEIDSAKKRLERLIQNIVGTMEGFRRDYPSETRDMDASIESEGEYRNLLDKLIRDNLPQFESKFKELLNENTIREIASFQAKLNRECEKIRERVEKINKSMSVIQYNKDRYIYLEVMNTNDVEVRSFRQELKSCIEGSFTGGETGRGSDQYTESKFLQVKALIDRFKGREGRSDSDRKWTRKVTDVRNWFAFAASERWIEDDSEYEHYTDSGGKSGGQKEKLAYTVLAASLAYQFGLEWGEVRSRSFRFVVIDEAFGRGSDESARFGLKLFRELNLQLLIVTPLQKIHIIEPYVSSVGFVHNPEGKKSYLRCLTIKQYREEKEKRKG
ncbi:MAG: hypothetical protein JXR86_02720 [Spirochaetales bacterium]|nr:hypothetical protein [Spirochaetales bacterium]